MFLKKSGREIITDKKILLARQVRGLKTGPWPRGSRWCSAPPVRQI